MPRKRMIDPEFWLDEQLAGCSFETRLFYIGTWNFADDYGVIEDSMMKLKAQIFPYDVVDIKPLRHELIRQNKLVQFKADGKEWLYIRKFLKWQRVEKPSKLRNPEAPMEIVGEDYPTPTLLVGDEVKRSEVKLSKEKRSEVKLSPLQLYEKFKSKILWGEIIKKYPDRDYWFYFQEMCDWYMENKNRLPKNISAFTRWLTKTQPDPALTSARLSELSKVEDRKKQEAMDKTPQARPETLKALREKIDNVKKKF